MSNEKDDDLLSSSETEVGRRDLLKKLSAGGSGLAIAKWTAPVVAVISIPAHAQTSGGFGASLVAVANF